MSKKNPERRRRRSHDVTQALHYQLDACRAGAEMQAMVLADDMGTPLAAVGAPETCEEIAARLPLVGRKAPRFQGVLLQGRAALRVTVRAFQVGPSELYVCAVGGAEGRSGAELERSVQGVTRILSAA